MKTSLVAGAGGFIGGHLVKRLLLKGHKVVAVDIKPVGQWYQVWTGASSLVMDLRTPDDCHAAVQGVDEIYNLACDMGGMGFIENNKALCMINVLINTNLLLAAQRNEVRRYFYASSACVYPDYRQDNSAVTALKESDAYPAMPEDGYGWEKLFSERMCGHFHEEFGIETRVFRFHNVYGPFGTWDGGREKAPAALCRKVIEAIKSGSFEIDIWGDGEQTRSFMYIDDCINGIDRLMQSDIREPLNLGSSQLVTINQLVDAIEVIAEVRLTRNYLPSAPQGVRGRNSDNQKIKDCLGWEPGVALSEGLGKTYKWIEHECLRRDELERT